MLGVNTLYRLSCFFELFPMVCKGLTQGCQIMGSTAILLCICVVPARVVVLEKVVETKLSFW